MILLHYLDDTVTTGVPLHTSLGVQILSSKLNNNNPLQPKNTLSFSSSIPVADFHLQSVQRNHRLHDCPSPKLRLETSRRSSTEINHVLKPINHKKKQHFKGKLIVEKLQILRDLLNFIPEQHHSLVLSRATAR